MVDKVPSLEERRQRGLELQAALPKSTGWHAKRLARNKQQQSEGAELAKGALDLALIGGPWGIVVAIPAAIIWILRRLRGSQRD